MAPARLPYLTPTPTSKQLIVDGKPFLILGAELQNSSMSSAAYMSSRWPNLAAMHINTVLGAVTWEAIEPTEGHFDFSELDQVIVDARAHGLRLVLLWFGSFKNGLSSYVPGWVKMDEERFPRAVLRKAGGRCETADCVSLFAGEAGRADERAFCELMRHVKEVDGEHQTVIMLQVENEPGVLGDSRDGSEAANKVFHSPVPEEVLSFLGEEYEELHPKLKVNLEKRFARLSPKERKEGRSWADVFGATMHTESLFMAYHYAKYIDKIAAAGAKEYNLPTFCNTWMKSDTPSDAEAVAGGGSIPGEYPSGGSNADVLDIWQKFAPALAFSSPDIYMNEYTGVFADYRHRGQVLFIPEQRRDEFGALRIWSAFGSYQAIGVSPFGIDTLDAATCALTKPYKLLSQVKEHVLEAHRRPNSSIGFFFDELNADGSDPSPVVKAQFGDWEVTVQRSFVFGKPGPGSGMLIYLPENEKQKPSSTGAVKASFLLIGLGFQVKFKSLNPKAHFSGLLSLEEKEVTNTETGEMRTVRRLNGDETRSGAWAMMPAEDPDYAGYPIAITVPAGTGIVKVQAYALLR